ncbi:hypothetical protein OROMI_010178 [Orobanche minor]
MRSSSKVMRVFLRLVVLLGVFGFLINVGFAENGERKMKIVAGNTGRNYTTNQIRVPSKPDLNYTTKRRTPSGSDPIHNRTEKLATLVNHVLQAKLSKDIIEG